MQQQKMSAPCRRMASRPLLHVMSCFSRTAVGNAGLRPFSITSVCRATFQSHHVVERAHSPWTLMAAVCLQRLPVISADRSPIEQQFRRMIHQMEREKSLLSDHELQLLEDAERMSRKLADDYDSEGEDDRGDQEIVLAQDLEDSWEQKMKSFQPSPRVTDADQDPSSSERCLADSLVLLAEQQVGGGEPLWLLPQARWQDGETLRQTAERALASLPAAGLKATFLGNAPCGVYKFKLPQAARTESTVGTKVFFFKAVLSDGGPPAGPGGPLLWAKRDELRRYLKPAYMTKLDRVVLGL